MAGYVFVDPAGISSDEDLKAWLGRALAFVESLPAKAAKSKRARAKGDRT